MNGDERFMREALLCAQASAENGEVPVGAVIVKDGIIVSRGYNRRETDKNALCHAELEAIDSACRTLGGWRLWQCELYVTLEPCPMCAGAIINARISAWCTARRTQRQVRAGLSRTCSSFPTTTGRSLRAACWRKNAPLSSGIFFRT